MSCNVKIMVVYHKNAPKYDSDILLPIHAGARISSLDLGIQRDDEGEHISEKNIYLGEHTAIYWAWKNLKTDYIGLFHYRRMLDFNDNYEENTMELCAYDTDLVERLGLDQQTFNDLYAGYDIVTRKIEDLRKWLDMTVYEHYDAEHMIEHFDRARDEIASQCPEYLIAFDEVVNGFTGYYANIFIMKWELFDEYCQWLFPILEPIFTSENHYNRLFQYTSKQSRFIGFVAERLTSVFIYKKIGDGFRVKELTAIVLVESTEKRWYEYNTYAFQYRNQTNQYRHSLPKTFQKSSKSLVNVFITIRAHEVPILSTLESVLNQTLDDIEITVIDYTDQNLPNTVMEIMDDNQTISYLKGDEKLFNKLIQQSSSSYIHMMDAGDMMENDFLEALVANALNYDSDIVICVDQALNDQGVTRPRAILPHTLLGYEEVTNIDKHPDLLLLFSDHWTKLYKTVFLQEFYIDNDGHHFSLFWHSITHAARISLFKFPLFSHRESIHQLASDATLKVFDSIEQSDGLLQQTFLDMKHKGYYCIAKRAKVADLLNRNITLLKDDQQFRERFFQCMKQCLQCHEIDDASTRKSMFFNMNHSLIEALVQYNYAQFSDFIMQNEASVFQNETFLKYQVGKTFS